MLLERYLAIDTKAIKLHMLIKIQLLDAYSKDITKKKKRVVLMKLFTKTAEN